ncbi:MAG: fructose-bisphosphate aldolase [Candidatus Lokiarchaeota archaeon]|nr:fructose-bisphosphate aldolase [Candidatus Lokiarchaeota archaeon]MBD3202164.1 fructose-bisphosphate aldolase [Candidatus Lokiarchaeota archaeon]
MNLGKKIRIERIIDRKSRRTIIIPMDHGLTLGPVKGLSNMADVVDKVAKGGANAVLEHSGMVGAGHREYGRDIGLIIHLSGATKLAPDPNKKVLVCSVERALKMGADAVSIHINIGANDEPEMLIDAHCVVESCREWGIPLLAMMYPRGEEIEDENDPEYVGIAVRVGAELGADMVKTNYTGDIDSFKYIVDSVPIPVIIAGGPKTNTMRDLFQMVYDSIQAGGAGVAFGRNVFQSENPTKLVSALSKIVHKGYSVDEVLKEFKFD